mgnify:CR=1 FL=1
MLCSFFWGICLHLFAVFVLQWKHLCRHLVEAECLNLRGVGLCVPSASTDPAQDQWMHLWVGPCYNSLLGPPALVGPVAGLIALSVIVSSGSAAFFSSVHRSSKSCRGSSLMRSMKHSRGSLSTSR